LLPDYPTIFNTTLSYLYKYNTVVQLLELLESVILLEFQKTAVVSVFTNSGVIFISFEIGIFGDLYFKTSIKYID
jgi:hypothetical protein